MNPPEFPNTDTVFDAYLCALKDSFCGEPWEAIERYARRIWIECRMDSDADWDTIRDRARHAWPFGSSPTPPRERRGETEMS